MADIFISHSGQDNEVAAAIGERIRHDRLPTPERKCIKCELVHTCQAFRDDILDARSRRSERRLGAICKKKPGRGKCTPISVVSANYW
jgi:hypothetical protein